MPTVLIVDDEIADTLVSGLKQCAGSADIEFRTAYDGAQCLTNIAAIDPDLILLDIGLPVIDGLTVLAELQKRKVRTRIIMMSGYKTDLATAIECVKAGACDYIVKGQIEARLLLERIRRALIVESTLNSRISELPASARKLIQEASLLKDEYDRLKDQNAEMLKKISDQRRRYLLEPVQKTVYILLACGCMLVLKWVGIVQTPLALLFVFVLLVVLLLIPADKIQSFSASINRIMKAQVNLERSEERDQNRNHTADSEN